MCISGWAEAAYVISRAQMGRIKRAQFIINGQLFRDSRWPTALQFKRNLDASTRSFEIQIAIQRQPGDAKLAAKVIDIPIWAFHGAKDRNVPVTGSREMIAAIKSAGGEPRYTEYPDQAHNIWYQVTVTPGLLDWLFAQSKE
jgi:pimeloyl-ACP methyl ester carboxylesterase